MTTRPWLLFPILAACFVLPYAFYHPRVQNTVDSLIGSSTSSPTDQDEVSSEVTQVSLPGDTTPMPTQQEGPVEADFPQIFRFTVTPEWIISQWARVSTAAGDLELDGYRVPLVTGIRHDDLAGVLTYYFDHRRILRKIEFRGSTGDPRRITLFLNQQYGLQPQVSDEPRTMLYETGRAAQRSYLKTVVQPMIEGSRPYDRYQVEMLLHLPSQLNPTSSSQLPKRTTNYQGQPW